MKKWLIKILNIEMPQQETPKPLFPDPKYQMGTLVWTYEKAQTAMEDSRMTLKQFCIHKVEIGGYAEPRYTDVHFYYSKDDSFGHCQRVPEHLIGNSKEELVTKLVEQGRISLSEEVA